MCVCVWCQCGRSCRSDGFGYVIMWVLVAHGYRWVVYSTPKWCICLWGFSGAVRVGLVCARGVWMLMWVLLCLWVGSTFSFLACRLLSCIVRAMRGFRVGLQWVFGWWCGYRQCVYGCCVCWLGVRGCMVVFSFGCCVIVHFTPEWFTCWRTFVGVVWVGLACVLGMWALVCLWVVGAFFFCFFFVRVVLGYCEGLRSS